MEWAQPNAGHMELKTKSRHKLHEPLSSKEIQLFKTHEQNYFHIDPEFCAERHKQRVVIS